MNGKFRLIRILLICALLVWSSCDLLPCYAQEQYIAESFGLYSKGVTYYHTGKLHEAREILERAVRLDPRNDEAQGYLDLVNAELKMRAKGKMDYYQRPDELSRESDSEFYSAGEYTDNPEYYEPKEKRTEYVRPSMEPEKPVYSEDKIKAIADALNEKIAPGKIRGEYKMAFGATSEDLIWKEANADYVERNFRMAHEQFPKTNTFDPKIYDRFRVVFDTNETGEGMNFHSDITVDPWSFVGKSNKITVTGSGGDTAEVELKYWSANRSTINETIPTLSQGDDIDLPELKVVDGKVRAVIVKDAFGETFNIPEMDIDTSFQPIRELWFDYNTDNSKFRIFPFGLENQAFSSDDPLGLSNHHIYWMPSPWLDDWEPGNFNSTASSFSRGEWSDDLSFFTRESEDLKRLTALRGLSFQGDLSNNSNLSFTVASPKGLWQDYDEVNAIPGAIRVKTDITDDLMIGLIDTFRIGRDDTKVDYYNNAFGVDASYSLDKDTNIVGEVAVSKSENDRTSPSYQTEKSGTAAHLAINKSTGLGKMRIALTHMDKGFDAGLADYRHTRNDLFWGRHIHFKEPIENTFWGSDPLTYEDIEPFRIGDGVDIGRKVLNFRLDTEHSLGWDMDNLIDYRYVRDADHKYVEGVFREENTLRINPEWTSKFLFIYHDLPKTKGGVDPIAYDTDTGEFLLNSAIEDGKDPSISTYSVGLEYTPEEWISIFGIY